jgi:hypothetical protein
MQSSGLLPPTLPSAYHGDGLAENRCLKWHEQVRYSIYRDQHASRRDAKHFGLSLTLGKERSDVASDLYNAHKLQKYASTNSKD